MPDLKISQLSSGTNAQAGDLFVIARSGNNFSLTTAQLFNAPTAAATLSSLTVSGNLTVDTNTLFVDATNNRVGIGTTSPSTQLHVDGGTSNPTLLISRSAFGAISTLALGDGTNNNRFNISTASNLTFTVGTTPTTLATLDTSGNLGIGVTPSVKLDVSGASNLASRGRFTNTSAGQTLQFGASRDTTTVPYIGSETNHSFSLITNNTERWRISAAGDFLAGADNSYDIGASGATRPRNVYAGTSLRAPSLIFTSGQTYTAGDTTPSVQNTSVMAIANSSPTTITNFTNGVEGQILVLRFADANTTINRNNCYLSGGTNFTSSSADTLTLIFSSPSWYEVARSVNA